MRILLVAILLLMILAGCEEGVSPVYSVGEFRVDGTVTHANISFRDFDGSGTNEYINVALPWSHSNEHAQSGEDFYLAAQSNDAAGDLTVTVLIDSVPVATETTSAAFGFVAVYGEVP